MFGLEDTDAVSLRLPDLESGGRRHPWEAPVTMAGLSPKTSLSRTRPPVVFSRLCPCTSPHPCADPTLPLGAHRGQCPTSGEGQEGLSALQGEGVQRSPAEHPSLRFQVPQQCQGGARPRERAKVKSATPGSSLGGKAWVREQGVSSGPDKAVSFSIKWEPGSPPTWTSMTQPPRVGTETEGEGPV